MEGVSKFKVLPLIGKKDISARVKEISAKVDTIKAEKEKKDTHLLKRASALDVKTFKTSGVPNIIDKKADGSLQVTTDKSTIRLPAYERRYPC